MATRPFVSRCLRPLVAAAPALAITAAVLAAACGSDPDVVDDDTVGRGTAGTGTADGGTGGTSVSLGGGGQGSGGEDGSTACAVVDCAAGTRCVVDADGTAACVDNSCGDLTCGPTEECQPVDGGGNRCVDVGCSTDVECPLERFCNGTLCQDDICAPGETRCDEADVRICTNDGGAFETKVTCGSAATFDSTCQIGGDGAAACTCQADWDCPAFQVCEVGVCQGTGKAPTCTLAPQEGVTPAQEFRWSGSGTVVQDATPLDHSDDAPRTLQTARAFPAYTQVASTPLVVNLDDDNGDGEVNELDFPEIVFVAHPGENWWRFGAVRAIHAGGPDKGTDYWVRCGATAWREGEPIPPDGDCTYDGGSNATEPIDDTSDAIFQGSAMLAAGDLTGDGYPEIVVVSQGIEDNDGSGPIRLRILNATGGVIARTEDALRHTDTQGHLGAPVIANLDGEGLPEIILGRDVWKLDFSANTLTFAEKLSPPDATGDLGIQPDPDTPRLDGPMVCVADLIKETTGPRRLEWAAGSTIYRLNAAGDGVDVVWNANVGDGFCAVADLLGADDDLPTGPTNPLDGRPEVAIISDGDFIVLEPERRLVRKIPFGTTGAMTATPVDLDPADTDPERLGGAPNIDDFDGDGFPEVATALRFFYRVVDLQAPSTACPAWETTIAKAATGTNPNGARSPGAACTDANDCAAGATCTVEGQCVCLHNGWQRATEDDSSRITSSSVFDFNGDGSAEVVYNDECYFRIYDGVTGAYAIDPVPSISRTIGENPVVADVDNDGNAEIVFVQNTATKNCGEAFSGVDFSPGIQVWGDAADTWVSARRIWNQHAYSVTNVTEDGTIPLSPPDAWLPLNGRLYNTYRSQPRSFGVAPDLTVRAVNVASSTATCGALGDIIDITAEIENIGDLRVGPGVIVTFRGLFPDGNPAALLDSDGNPLAVTLDVSLEPGRSTIVSVPFDRSDNPGNVLPSSVSVIVDSEDAENECREDNNSASADVVAPTALPDLTVTLTSSSCTRATASVTNGGESGATDVVVRVYQGNPSQGGRAVGDATVSVPAGATESVDVTYAQLSGVDITLWAVVDATSAVDECSEANNRASAASPVACTIIQ